MNLPMMACRQKHLALAVDGYYKTGGVPFIEFNGAELTGSCPLDPDDMGIYYFIPKLAYFLNLDVYAAVKLFFYGTAVFAFLCALTAFFLLFKSIQARIASLYGLLLLARISMSSTDVYTAYISIAVATMPLALYFFYKQYDSKGIFVFMFLAGMFLQISHHIRTYAQLGPLCFILMLLILNQHMLNNKKILLALTLLLGAAVPYMYFKKLYKEYTTYMSTHGIEDPYPHNYHPFWHPLYLGFSFVSAGHGITFDDTCAYKRAKEVNPNTVNYSQEYDAILCKEVINLVKSDPWFVAQTIFAKLGVLLLYILVFMNLGFIAIGMYPKNWRTELAFITSLALSAIPAMVAIPTLIYATGLIACAALYGLVSLCYGLEIYFLKKRK